MWAAHISLSLVVLIVSVAIAVYILIGYPLLLAVLRFRQAPPVRKDLRRQSTVSLIMSVYNGAAHVRAKLNAILALDYPQELLEIVIVSDGSTDETESMVREYADRAVQLIVASRGGKAAALQLR